MPTPLETPNAETRTTFIYALCEPGTKTIRYIGKTDGSLNARLAKHISGSKRGVKNYYSSCWIRKLQKTGQNPEIHALLQVPRADFERFERAFIFVARHCGMRLTNLTDGGEGASGLKHTPEACAKISAAQKGKKRPRSAEHSAKIGAAQKGQKRSPETCAKMSAAKKGRKLSLETRVKMSAASKGKKKSPWTAERCAKKSAALTGRKLTLKHCANISAGVLGCNRSDNTSGFVGVDIDSRRGWRARVKTSHIGSFSKIEDAVFARNITIANL